ncbi:AT-rich interactive domain-containing protein 3A [Homalodisca vitripennis]|nr:AT-rich interactive domain-containing protein 3A [Homalodisca vitripennis]
MAEAATDTAGVSGTPINRLPIMAKSVLDLFELYNLVIQRGGLVDVINKKLWQEIIKGLHLPSSITSAAFTLRTQIKSGDGGGAEAVGADQAVVAVIDGASLPSGADFDVASFINHVASARINLHLAHRLGPLPKQQLIKVEGCLTIGPDVSSLFRTHPRLFQDSLLTR